MVFIRTEGRARRGMSHRHTRPASKTARKALRIAKKALSDLVTITDSSTAILSNAPTITHLLVTGDVATQSFDYTSVRLNIEIRQDLASALIDSWRVMLILDKQPNGTAMTAGDIFLDATPGIVDQPKFDVERRFRILYDQRGAFESENSVARQINIRRKLNYASRSAGTTQVITAIETNALFLFRWTTATADQPTFNFSSRMAGTS